MPRAYDTDEQRKAEVPAGLVFTEIVDCPLCGEAFDGVFTDPAMDAEDMAEPPRTEQCCPGCGHRWIAELTGWTNYGDA